MQASPLQVAAAGALVALLAPLVSRLPIGRRAKVVLWSVTGLVLALLLVSFVGWFETTPSAEEPSIVMQEIRCVVDADGVAGPVLPFTVVAPSSTSDTYLFGPAEFKPLGFKRTHGGVVAVSESLDYPPIDLRDADKGKRIQIPDHAKNLERKYGGRGEAFALQQLAVRLPLGHEGTIQIFVKYKNMRNGQHGPFLIKDF